MNSGNCQELDGQTDVDGFLVGGPSLKVHILCSDLLVCFNQYHYLMCLLSLLLLHPEFIDII